MIRNLFLLIVLFILSSAANAQDTYRAKGDKLNVRDSNSSNGKIIGTLAQNETVLVTDSADAKFYKVKVKGTEGWVSKQFLEKVASTAPKPTQTPVVAASKPQKDYSPIIFFAIVLIVSLGVLFFTFKYAMGSKVLVVFATLLVLTICYFCYTMILKEKSISGLFTSDSDTQYQTFNFKGNNQVEVKDSYADSTFTTHYVIEGDLIKLQQQENTILLMIRDEQTLIGEGFTKGIYNKN